jgi:uncharacterized membrane protein
MTAETSSPRNTRLGLAIAVAIGLLAAQPLLFGRLAAGSDTYFHIHRLWQVQTLFQQGIFFSRWSPDLPFGFGSPIFNYYGPLPYYFALPFVWLTSSLVMGYAIALALALIATSVGMFLWLRELMSDLSAFAGAAAFVLAPYALSNVYGRGALAEPFAVAMVPYVLWSLHRLIKTRQWKYMLICAAAYAALALSHNATLLLLTPAIVALNLADWRKRWAPPLRWSPSFAAVISLAWGLALAALFILPAFLERNLVQIERIYASVFYDYHNNFQSLVTLIANPAPLDPKLIGNVYDIPIGLVSLTLAFVSFIGFARLRRAHIAVAAVGAFVCIFMVMPQSVFIWEGVPLLRVLQFPRRWLMPASLFLAVLIGFGCEFALSFVTRPWLKVVFTACCLVGLATQVFSMQLVTNKFPITYAPTAQQVAELELQYNVIGTTNTGEYLPIAVKQLPLLQSSPLLRQGRRLDPQSLTTTARVLSETYTSLTYDVTLDTPQPFDALFTTFYFPGWQAFIDGAAADIKPSAPHGFIRVSVPAGQHRLQISFGSTPIRTAAAWLSLIAAFLWVVTAIKLTLRPSQGAL